MNRIDQIGQSVKEIDEKIQRNEEEINKVNAQINELDRDTGNNYIILFINPHSTSKNIDKLGVPNIYFLAVFSKYRNGYSVFLVDFHPLLVLFVCVYVRKF